MSFHDICFPSNISMRSSGGPERRTRIIALAGGHEERNSPWRHSRRRYDAGYGVRSLDDLHEVISFFEARQGRLYSFRWKDWSDWKSCAPSKDITAFDQHIATADGEQNTFQLIKAYSSGASTYRRPISLPSALKLALDGQEQTSGFTLDPLSGQLTFEVPPIAGMPLTAGFIFHVKARFDTDMLDINLEGFRAGNIPSIPIAEVLR